MTSSVLDAVTMRSKVRERATVILICFSFGLGGNDATQQNVCVVHWEKKRC